MPFEDLLYDSSRICVEMAGDVIYEKPELFAEAFELVLKNTGTISSRSSRAIYFSFCKNPAIVKPYLDIIIDAALNIENTSIRQNLLRLLSESELSAEMNGMGSLINSCFQWIKAQ